MKTWIIELKYKNWFLGIVKVEAQTEKEAIEMALKDAQANLHAEEITIEKHLLRMNLAPTNPQPMKGTNT